MHNGLNFFTAQVSTKRRRPATESDSDSDDYVVSASELKRARSEARYWRHRCEEAIKEKAQLTNIIESMNGTIASKLTASKYVFIHSAVCIEACGSIQCIFGDCMPVLFHTYREYLISF